MIYSGPGWEIREGRWQDSPPESVDVVLSDPPYDAATHKGHALQCRNRPEVQFDPVSPADFVPGLLALVTRWAVCFCSMEQIGRYADAAGASWVRGGMWFKPDGAPQFSRDRPAVPGECIAIMHAPKSKRWNGGGRRGMWTFNRARGDDRNHETPKPVDLMLSLVADFTDPGELVWDPYAGSGTTGVACLRLGRRFLGHEMQPHYAEVAAERLKAETLGLTLQDHRRGQTSLLERIGDDDG